MADSTLDNPTQASTDSYYYLPYTLPVHLPGLVSTNPADSPHMPLPQKALPPEVVGFTDIQPERNGTDFGMDTSFKYVPNDYEVLKEAILMVKLAPLVVSASAVGGSNPRYPADVLCHAIEYYNFQIGGQTIFQKYGDTLHFDELVEDNPDEYLRKSLAQGIDIPENSVSVDMPGRVQRADRTFNGGQFAGGQWFMLELPFWFSDSAAKNWHQYACQRQTRINIHWRNPDSILQQDGNAIRPLPDPAVSSTYIMECYLRFRVSSMDTTTKDTFTDAVKAQGSNGLNYLVRYIQRQDNHLVSTGATGTSIQLLNFNKPTYMLRFVIRKQSNLINSEPTDLVNDRWSLADLGSYYMEASGHRVWPEMSQNFAKLMVNGREFLNKPDQNVFHVLHTDYPDVNQYPMGCIEYAKLNNPTLNIKFSTPPSENLIVDVWAYCYDYLRLVISSDNRSAVALEQPI